MDLENFYRDKRVLLTGHTGFKGSWLCEWLMMLGADVYGYGLDPQSNQVLFESLDLGSRISGDVRSDVREIDVLRSVVQEIRPQIIFHLAAQPLVRHSYLAPIETFEVNALGTANLLECIRGLDQACTAVFVTTDKCYENKEWFHSYREIDPMGGFDPYSASKGCAELILSSYRRSFFEGQSNVILASARAGNVIGGGDWAEDRIVPDCFRAINVGVPIAIRNKTATRPWQHVLEPLSGYLQLAMVLSSESDESRVNLLCDGMNFGPSLSSNRNVVQLVDELLKHAPGTWEDHSDPDAPHEASKLNLAVDKAFHLLGWLPVWGFEDTVKMTASWYISHCNGASAKSLCKAQIDAFTTASHFQPWATSS